MNKHDRVRRSAQYRFFTNVFVLYLQTLKSQSAFSVHSIPDQFWIRAYWARWWSSGCPGRQSVSVVRAAPSSPYCLASPRLASPRYQLATSYLPQLRITSADQISAPSLGDSPEDSAQRTVHGEGTGTGTAGRLTDSDRTPRDPMVRATLRHATH